jgi:hypothetical protein
MYRLIVRIVDLANSQLNLTAYFEFSQVSGHGTSQSVDIALLDGFSPKTIIEAKRVGRRIGSDQISKYLPPDIRGIVADGIRWILCFDSRSRALLLCDAESNAIKAAAVQWPALSSATATSSSSRSTDAPPKIRPGRITR